jgi:hypothetical protein
MLIKNLELALTATASMVRSANNTFFNKHISLNEPTSSDEPSSTSIIMSGREGNVPVPHPSKLCTHACCTDGCLCLQTLLPPPDLTATSRPYCCLRVCILPVTVLWPCNSIHQQTLVATLQTSRPPGRASTSPCLQRPSRPPCRQACSDSPRPPYHHVVYLQASLQTSRSPCHHTCGDPPAPPANRTDPPRPQHREQHTAQ